MGKPRQTDKVTPSHSHAQQVEGLRFEPRIIWLHSPYSPSTEAPWSTKVLNPACVCESAGELWHYTHAFI